ncbi:MAG: MaoC family dehydratase [Lysobacterales bacterium]|jgi:acyl dehydratase
MTAEPTSITALAARVGRPLEPSDWMEITQERVNRFADATNDHQYIHVDPERAAATPLGGTIAHGFLTLSLVPWLTAAHFESIQGVEMGLNYGLDKVRFLQPVRVGSRIRSHMEYLSADEKQAGRWLVKSRVTVEIEGQDKPALIAETLAMFIVK